MLFWCRECLRLATACRKPGAAATLLIIMIAAGRGGFSPQRMLLAGMALSTAFTMLLMMLGRAATRGWRKY